MPESRTMTAARQETLARAVEATKPLFTRYLAGFDESSSVAQPPGLPNHAVWMCGHCALTMHRLAARFDQQPLPESNFITGDGTAGDAQRFDTESVCIGSEPVAQADRYPGLERAKAIYEAACDRLAAALRGASEEQLDATIPWHDGELTHEALVLRVCFHNGVHGGQLTDLRRALRMERLIVPQR